MSVTVKRKRGRPRLDEPREIQDFDNNLIQEFKKFPVFYDRQHPQHRNREYTDRIWQRIGQTLNVSTSLVKTRMLQLRNRFNLEKRRVEAMKEQTNSFSTSQWSLYERLSFLSNYVKTRRPYSLPISSNSKMSSSASSSEAEDNEVDEVEDEKSQDCGFTPNQINNGNFSNNKEIDIGLLANQKYLPADEVDLQQTQRSVLQPMEYNIESGSKYKSFGQFLASSLIEMNEVQALNLVEKFTIDLVKYLQIEERKKCFTNIPYRNNTDGEDENSSTINCN